MGDPVVAMDEGADGNQEVLTYTISGGTDASSYAIDGATGQVRVGATANLNIETPPTTQTEPPQPDANPTDEITVRATDPTDRYADVTVTINVTNVDENPIIVTGLASHQPAENSHQPTPDLDLDSPYTAWDPEDGTDLEWSVTGTDRARFDISQTGQLSFKAAPNYESPTDSGRNNSYDIAVTATDSAGNTGSRTVTVNVGNDQEDGSISLSNRGARVGTSLTARLTDDDRVIGRVEWTWAGATTTVRMGGVSDTYAPHCSLMPDRTLTITARYKDGEAGDAEQTARPDPQPSGSPYKSNATPTTPVLLGPKDNNDTVTLRLLSTIVENNQAGPYRLVDLMRVH